MKNLKEHINTPLLCPFCGHEPSYRIGEPRFFKTENHPDTTVWINDAFLECCIRMTTGFGKFGTSDKEIKEEEGKRILYEKWNTRVKIIN